MSLTQTCVLQCHNDGDEETIVDAGSTTAPVERFCQQCHDYADVHLDCWDCHVGP